MIRTCNQMYIYRSEIPPRQVISKYLIAMYLSNDVIMKICNALQMQREADHTVFDDKKLLIINKQWIMKKNKWIISTLYIYNLENYS